MIAVSDTGPLNYLIQVDAVEALPRLYRRVLIPEAVYRELMHERSDPRVKAWLANEPDWLEVVSVADPIAVRGLHAGELEAMALARDMNASFLLMDDSDARTVAKKVTAATVVGTIAVLVAVSRLDEKFPARRFEDAIAKLRKTNFFFSPSLDAAITQLQRSLVNR